MRRQFGQALLVLALAGCKDVETGPNISGTEDLAIVSVSIEPSTDTIFVPDTIRVTDRVSLRGVGKSWSDTRLTGLQFVWRSSDPTVATVDSFGVVSAVRVGTVDITASAGKVGHATVVVRPATRQIVLTPRVDTIFVDEPGATTSDSVRILAQAYDVGGTVLTGVRYTWQSSAGGIATVDSSGLVRGVSFGTATLTVSAGALQGTATILVRPLTERVELLPAVDTILVDDPIVPATFVRQLNPTAFSLEGTALTGVHYAWLSSAANVATVDTNGVAHAVALGTTTVTVTAALAQATKELRVVPLVKAVFATSPVPQVLDGDTLALAARATDYADQDIARTFAWTSSDPSVATVDASGRATFVGVGSTTFTATTAFRSSSVTVTSLPRKLLAADAGGDFSCGVTALGRGYCWGRGDFGQLASPADSLCFDDTTNSKLGCTLEPKRVGGPAIAFQVVAAGNGGGCGISDQQRLYCWGDDSFGEIGNGSKGGGDVPTLATVGSEKFATLTVGGAHSCALNITGRAYCWGLDSFGQLGDHRRVNSTTPIPVVGPTGFQSDALQFSRISAGESHTCGIRVDGYAFCWGSGVLGALGNNGVSSDIPDSVRTNVKFTDISAGIEFTCAVAATSGDLYCWGTNESGQIGNGTFGGQISLPVKIGTDFKAVSAGGGFACALRTSGQALCWGRNTYGQIGRGDANPTGVVPSPVSVFGGQLYTSITAGVRHACALATDTETYCWGSNMFGALGNQLQAAVRARPVLVARPR